MIKRFLDGLVFGSGFALAFIAIFYGAFWLFSEEEDEYVGFEGTEPVVQTDDDNTPNFGNLSAYEKAGLASVVMLVEFRQDSHGEYRAYISEILKVEPGTNFSLQVGDEYQRASSSARDYYQHSEGAVVMLVGTDAKLETISSYQHGRIGGYGNITLDTFRKMVELTSSNAVPADSFYTLSTAEAVSGASVILDIEFVAQDDASISGIVREIIKRDSSLQEGSLVAEISVGDNYRFGEFDGLPLLRDGDGAIIFMAGSEPKHKLTAGYKDGFVVVGINGRTSIDEIRKLASE